jgi:hypothetical protein
MVAALEPNFAGFLMPETSEKIGDLVIVSIRDSTLVPFAELQEAWKQWGIAGVAVSKPGSVKKAFRKATPKGARDKRFYFMPYDGAARLNRMVDAVVLVESLDEVGRVDKQHKNLGVLCLRDDDSIEFESDYVTTPEAERFLQTIRTAFAQNLGKASPRQIRGMVIRALELSSKITYHDGVHLVPNQHLGNLDRIAAFVKWLDGFTRDEQTFFRIPYADTAETREDVKVVLKRSIEEECGQIIKEAHDFVRTRKNPSALSNGGKNKGLSMLAELGRLEAMITDFEDVLSEQQTFLKVALGAKRGLVEQILGFNQAPTAP